MERDAKQTIPALRGYVSALHPVGDNMRTRVVFCVAVLTSLAYLPSIDTVQAGDLDLTSADRGIAPWRAPDRLPSFLAFENPAPDPHSPMGLLPVELGGELRERAEIIRGSFAPPGPSSALLSRLLLNADVRATADTRAFIQLGVHGVSGRDRGQGPTDADGPDIQQAYLDHIMSGHADDRFTVRVGRQELSYGSGRFVSVREGPNIRRSFDGARGMYRSEFFDTDVFAVHPVLLRTGAFDDGTSSAQTFWGFYNVLRVTNGLNADLYYLGLENRNASYAVGSGREDRQTFGARLWGTYGAFDYNIETAGQVGRFGDRRIEAGAIASDIGWTAIDLPLGPRFGIKLNTESGDRSLSDHRLNTFNPLFPSYAYFSEAPLGAPTNSMDAQPNIRLKPSRHVELTLTCDIFWRASTMDDIYDVASQPIKSSIGSGKFEGSLYASHLTWQVSSNVDVALDYTRFVPSTGFRRSGSQTVSFAMSSVKLHF